MAATTTDLLSPPNLSALLAPILPALPPAAASPDPAPGLLPYLAPILRQRVQILSSSTSSISPSSSSQQQQPWLRLLCYDPARCARLVQVVSSGCLEPHPISGEVEVDWDRDVEVRFRRRDPETLQALVRLLSLDGLAFRLVYCTGDPDGVGGAGDGWRIGEVTMVDDKEVEEEEEEGKGAAKSIAEAERVFRDKAAMAKAGETKSALSVGGGDAQLSNNSNNNNCDEDDDDDDDDYWDRYAASPSRTPGNTRSPAPPSGLSNVTTATHLPSSSAATKSATVAAEDDYFAQYENVQPAMDPDDPPTPGPQVDDVPPLQHPRPRSGTASTTSPNPSFPSPSSSHPSVDVARLERSADKREEVQFGVRQHVARSVRSLFLLASGLGIRRDEFEQMVRGELDVLGMMEE